MYKDYLSMIILFCLKNFNGERSLSAIYYLLKGKRTSQTIQDGKLYQLSFLFRLFPNMTKELLEKRAFILEKEQLIASQNGQAYLLTEQGEKMLSKQIEAQPFPKNLDGWTYHTVALTFWDRLVLIVQTISNIVHREKDFIPISQKDETLHWVRNFLLTKGKSKHVLSENIHHELFHFLAGLPNSEATIFVLRLTSYRRVGLTVDQISALFKEDVFRIHVMLYGILHQMIKEVLASQSEYPILYFLLKDLHKSAPLTYSTQKTYQLLKLGKSLMEIAAIRQLKVNTIEDHVVELAHNLENFSIEPYMDNICRKNITKKIKELKTNQLKEIRQALNNDASYFQIRLVLAKVGDQHGN